MVLEISGSSGWVDDRSEASYGLLIVLRKVEENQPGEGQLTATRQVLAAVELFLAPFLSRLPEGLDRRAKCGEAARCPQSRPSDHAKRS